MSEVSTDKTCFVTFFPVEAPVYGGDTIEVQFSKEILLPAENNVFLVYEGEHLRHVTGVRKVNETCALQAVIPANHREENVTLSAYLHEDGEQPRKIQGQDTFSFFYDSIAHLAFYLAEAIDNPSVIEDVETLKSNKFSLPPDLQTHQLDEKLVTVFQTLDGISGKGFSIHEEHGITTLLHFAASLGLQQLIQHLLSLPGVQSVLNVKNKNGLLAEDIAFQAGLVELASLMHRCRKEKIAVEAENNRNLHSDVSIRKTCIGTWNLTSSIDPQKSVVSDIAMLKNTASLAVTEAAQRKRRLQMRSWPSVEKSVSIETQEVDQEQRDQMDSDQGQLGSGKAMGYQHNHTFTIPTINITSHASRRGSLILEDSLVHLQDLTEGIQHLRDRNQRLLRVEGQGLHSRFSTSCPSLAEVVNSSGGNQESNPERGDTDVKICVTEDGDKDVDDDSDTLKADEEWKLRRRSWCAISQHPPEKMQRNKLTRSMSLSSLDSNESASDTYHDANELPAASSQSGTSEYKTVSSTSISASMKPGRVRQGSVSDTALNILGGSSLNIPNSYSDDVDRGRRHSSHSVTSLGQVELEVPLDSPDGSEHRMRRKSAGAVVAGSREHLSKSSSDEETPSATLTKCTSTPSLLSKTTSRTMSENLGLSRAKVADRTGRPGTISEGIPPLPQMRRPRPSDSQGTPTHILIQRLTREYDSRSAPDDDEMLSNYLQEQEKKQTEVSLTDFLRELDSDEDRSREKKDKKTTRRGSRIFGMSNRKKRQLRERELNRASHRFMSVCYSKSTQCDVCGKDMADKAAIQCENCLLTVHESCQDEVTQCIRSKKPPLSSRNSQFYTPASSQSLDTASVQYSQSFNEAAQKKIQKQPHSLSSGALLGGSLERNSGTTLTRSTSVASGFTNWQRVTSRFGVNRNVTSEVDSAKSALGSSTVLSLSVESLDDGAVEQAVKEDPDLKTSDHEPEAWSITVDKKMLKKMSAKEIKRQDVIFELIQTEKHHCRTLKVMVKIFRDPLRKELNYGPDIIDRLFPSLDELVDLHSEFLGKLKERQKMAAAVEEVGDILIEFFGSSRGERLKAAYGNFCSKRLEADAEYKTLLKTDRKFQSFVNKRSMSTICQKKDIPQHILLVTQRMTKYPVLIEAMMKACKTDKPEHKQLKLSLDLVKSVLHSIDDSIAYHEREKRLEEIHSRIDSKSVGVFKGGRGFKKSDLRFAKRKLLYEGTLYWKTARGKLIEVLAVLLTDVLFFLQESNQKYNFVSQDGKSGVISLQKLLVREKAAKDDSCGLYLISSNRKDPEMYEMVCTSSKAKKQWIAAVRDAVEKCPADMGDEEADEMTEFNHRMQLRSARLKELMEEMSKKDKEVAIICDQRVAMVEKMLELLGQADAIKMVNWTYSSADDVKKINVKEISQKLLEEITQISVALTGGSNLYRSASSAGEHESSEYSTPALPKRAETFGGFDSPSKESTSSTNGGKGALKKKSAFGKDETGNSQTSLTNSDSSSEAGSSEAAAVVQLRRRDSNTEEPSKDRLSVVQKETRVSRRSSSFLQGMLPQKLFSDRCEEVEKQQVSIEQSGGDGLAPIILPPSKETATSALQVTHYINGLLNVLLTQHTEIEGLRVSLMEAQDKMEKLAAESGRDAREKKTQFRHNQQLEELRNLQETINREREELQQEKERQAEDQEKSQTEIQKLKEQLQSQHAELGRQRDALQRQYTFYHKQAASQSTLGSENKAADVPPESVKLTYFSANTAAPKSEVERRATLHESSSSLDNIEHVKRSNTDIKDYKPGAMKQSTSNVSLKSRTELPMHLLSATNEKRMVHSASESALRQQIPLKLLSDNSSSSAHNSPNVVTQKPPSGSTIQQLLPLKLSQGVATLSSSPPVTSQKPPQGRPPVAQHNRSPGQSVQQKLPMKLASVAQTKDKVKHSKSKSNPDDVIYF